MDFNTYFTLLAPNGKFIMVGAPENPISIQVLPILFRQISFTGSLIGSPATIEEMLRLASEHNIVADVQTFPIEQVNEAVQGVRDGKPQFRYVLKITH
jgi:D-arabinose 1-dehydrogenase-like Zn-dependent alcohol dehydrogenase